MCWKIRNAPIRGAAWVAVALCAGLLPVTGATPAGNASDRPEATLHVGIVAGAGAAGDALVSGAERAAREWNAAHVAPQLELFVVRPLRPWHDGPSMLARLVFERDLAVLVGSDDAATAHAAAQIATAKRIPFITVSPEDDLTRVFDPWIFRGVPSDGEQARAVLRWAFPDPTGRRVTLVVPPGRPGRERLAALEDATSALGVEVSAHCVVAGDGSGDLPEGLAATDAVLLWLDPDPARAVVTRLRDFGFSGRVLGNSRLDDPAFRAVAEGVALPQFALGKPAASHVLARQGYALVRTVAVAAASADSTDDIRGSLTEGSSAAPTHFDDHGNRLGEIRVGLVCHGVVYTTTSPCGDPP